MKKGFTLAEVLITVAIIGVVAAITLPGLQTNITDQALEKQTYKFYNTLSNAVDNYLVDNRLDNIYDGGLNSDENIRRYFKVASACNPMSMCFADNYKFINGGQKSRDDVFAVTAEKDPHYYLLADGTAFAICNFDGGKGNDSEVFVDVNGPKGPNIIGRDMWIIAIDAPGDDRFPTEINGFIGSRVSLSQAGFDACASGTTDYGCFEHFMRNGFKFDY